jgi:hypothetical protein
MEMRLPVSEVLSRYWTMLTPVNSLVVVLRLSDQND